MAHNEDTKYPAPPYVSYKSLRNFLDSLKVAMPARIDRSVMSSTSGGVQTQILAALEYLGLIKSDGEPQNPLIQLAKADGKERQDLLKDILTNSYKIVFSDGFDLESATSDMLREKFSLYQISGQTSRKCIAFFMHATKDAGFNVSPHLKQKVGRPRSSGPKERRRNSGKKGNQENNANKNPPDDESQYQKNIMNLLLDKFPEFDPEWPEEVQSKWFDGFDKLMDKFKNENGD